MPRVVIFLVPRGGSGLISAATGFSWVSQRPVGGRFWPKSPFFVPRQDLAATSTVLSRLVFGGTPRFLRPDRIELRFPESCRGRSGWICRSGRGVDGYLLPAQVLSRITGRPISMVILGCSGCRSFVALAVISRPGCGELKKGSPRPAEDNRSAIGVDWPCQGGGEFVFFAGIQQFILQPFTTALYGRPSTNRSASGTPS